jgi:chromate transporter
LSVSTSDAPPSLAEATRVWARIGCLSFGGPAGQIAMMHKVLVDERRWIGEQRFLHALNYCMLLPGPEAQQLATYVGWLMHRTVGGLIAGLLFILPGALVMLGLSIAYVLAGDAPIVQSLFFGVKAAVVAIVLEAVLRIGRRALVSWPLRAIALAAFIALYGLGAPFPLVILAAGFAGYLGAKAASRLFERASNADAPAAPMGAVDRMFERGELGHAVPSTSRALKVLAVWAPLWLAPLGLMAAVAGPEAVWTRLAAVFSLLAVVTFGGAYAALAYVAQAAVETFGWLAPGEMADGLGLAESTPGPLILVLQFVGFLAAYRQPGTLDPLLAGTLGALVTLWATFAPCFLWIFVGGPYIEAARHNKDLAHVLAGVSAAVVGVIANLGLWLAVHTLFAQTRALSIGPELPVLTTFDWRAALLAALAGVALVRFKLGVLPVLAACALAGLGLSTLS